MTEERAEPGNLGFLILERRWIMSNRVRYYITESDNQPVVRSVPVVVNAQPSHELIEIERRPEAAAKVASATPVGRIVKVLRKPASTPSS